MESKHAEKFKEMLAGLNIVKYNKFKRVTLGRLYSLNG